MHRTEITESSNSQTQLEITSTLYFPVKIFKTSSRLSINPWLQNHIFKIKNAFAKHVICHTLDSVDYQGHKSFGMRSYQEHIMLLELHPWEKQALNAITDQMVQNAPLTTLISSTSMTLYFFQSNSGSSLFQLLLSMFCAPLCLLLTFLSSSNHFQHYHPDTSCS